MALPRSRVESTCPAWQCLGMSDQHLLRVSFDREVNAAYIGLQLRDSVQPSVATTVPVDDDIILDFDDEGRLIGIEVLAATKRLHPALLDDAVDFGG